MPYPRLLPPAAIAAILLMAAAPPSHACTSFRLKTADGAVVIGRSLEFALDLQSRLVTHPRGETKSSQAPGGKTGLKWTSKYGVLAVDAFGMDVAIDGMNDRGLSYHALLFPGYAGYQDAQAGAQPEKALTQNDLGLWVLGNFATVSEVRAALPGVQVWGVATPQLGGSLPAHFAIHDATGKSLVVEYVGGQLKIYDNEVGVMTNSPPFDWQLINLGNYLSLRAFSTQSVTIQGTVLSPPGQGGGFLGIPGDWTPPSRFVRTAAMMQFSKQAATGQTGANLALHLLNAVDIPKGDLREKAGDPSTTDYTQWITIYDLKNLALRFRSYDNTTIRAVKMRDLDFSPGAARRVLPLVGGTPEIDATRDLRRQ